MYVTRKSKNVYGIKTPQMLRIKTTKVVLSGVLFQFNIYVGLKDKNYLETAVVCLSLNNKTKLYSKTKLFSFKIMNKM